MKGQLIEVSFAGDKEIHRLLAKFMEPELSKRCQRATKAGAKVMAKPLVAAVTPLSKRMGRSVYVHVAKRDKPAYIVGHHRKTAFFWHMVIGGTKEHSLTPRKGLGSQGGAGRKGTREKWPVVRGVAAHPVVAQVAAQYGDQAYRAMVDDLMKET